MLEPLQNQEAIGFFENKGYRVGYHWGDVWQQEHARAFTVAKAMKLDLLQDIRQEVDRALREGLTFREFRENLMPRLDRHGWTGFRNAIDPLTGELQRVELGTPRRLRIIYDTNLRMANAAGRWERIERNARLLPILVYTTRDDARVREAHRPWHEIALPIEHVFWETHYPPNGWRCRCIVIQMSVAAAERRGLQIGDAPEINFVNRIHPRTGETIRVPEGVAPGFAYNVGRAHMRGLTPPPLTGPIGTPRRINRPADVPMPLPRERPATDLLPDDVSDDDAIDAFLNSFGAARSRPVVFEDRLGQPLVISDDFFRRANGDLKIGKRRRAPTTPLLAAALQDPDEIWWVWEQRRNTGEYILRRRYFAHFQIEGRDVPALVVVDVGQNGWRGVTAFDPDRVRDLENARRGVLGYRRSDADDETET